jgi:hypothetical protein
LIPSNSNYSLIHILIDCVDVADIREILYDNDTLCHLIQINKLDKVLSDNISLCWYVIGVKKKLTLLKVQVI